jgi:hypothetical protein
MIDFDRKTIQTFAQQVAASLEAASVTELEDIIRTLEALTSVLKARVQRLYRAEETPR